MPCPRRERQIECGALPREVFVQLTHRFADWSALRFLPLRLRLGGMTTLWKRDAVHGGRITRDE